MADVVASQSELVVGIEGPLQHTVGLEGMEEDCDDIEGDCAEINSMDEENVADCYQDGCLDPAIGLEAMEEDRNDMEEDLPGVNALEKEKLSQCNIDASVEPTVGMEFETYLAAGKFYNCYAKSVGFDTKIRQSRSNRVHGKWYVQFSCNKEGFKRAKSGKSGNTRRDRPDVRCGCLATMKIRLIGHNKWRVFHVNLVHSHEVSPRRVQQLGFDKQLGSSAECNQAEQVEQTIHLEEIAKDSEDMEEDIAEIDQMEEEKSPECNQDGLVEPATGMEFESHVAAGKFYNRYAKHVGFDTKIRQSRSNLKHGKRYVQFSCNKEGFKRAKPARDANMRRDRPDIRCGCLATMKIKLIGQNKWRVFHVNLVHNHAVGERKARNARSHKQLHNVVRRRSLLTAKEGLKVNRTSRLFPVEGEKHMQLSFGQKEVHNYSTKCVQLGLGEGDVEAMRMFFASMQARSSNFFYSVDLGGEGCLRNIFWVDARSRAAYEYFGDVVTFETTNLSNMHNLKFAHFVGVNHHGQLILLGCALLSSETKQSFVWAFKTWLMAMSDRPPNAIISDQSETIQGAVAEVFPQAHHRMCLWHIMQKIPEKISFLANYKEIERAMRKAVYESLRIHEFEQDWNEMIVKYNLEGNAWLKTLYQLKEKWVPAFLKNAFWAGMSTIQRNESVNSIFGSNLQSKSCFKDFFKYYESVLNAKYAEEDASDFANISSQPISKPTHWFETQLVNIYTVNIFKRFQQEVCGMLRCYDMSPVHFNGVITTYALKERIMDVDGQLLLPKEYEVYYNKTEVEVSCICNLFEFAGFLCRHALYVLQNQGVFEIPPRYIMARWRKNFKKNLSVCHGSTNLMPNTSAQWYDLLRRKCNEIVEEGVISGKGCLAALQVLEEVWQKNQVQNDQGFQEQGGETTGHHVHNALDITINSNGPVFNPNGQAITSQPMNDRLVSNQEKRKKGSYQKLTATTPAICYPCVASEPMTSPANPCKKRRISYSAPDNSAACAPSETVMTPASHELGLCSSQLGIQQMGPYLCARPAHSGYLPIRYPSSPITVDTGFPPFGQLPQQSHVERGTHQ